MRNEKLQKIILSAMFAALCCIATMIIRVPTFGTNGYVNIGDSIVLISAWIIGGPYGALAAGIGSALADLLAGYVAYVPGTFVIKFTMAFIGAKVYAVINKKISVNQVAYISSAVVAEIIMIAGYFVYESVFLGYGLAAVPSIISNSVQGVTCLVIGVLLINALKGSTYVFRQISKS